MKPELIDAGRYRTANAIVRRYAAGETVKELAREYGLSEYEINLVVAAEDRGGRYIKGAK